MKHPCCLKSRVILISVFVLLGFYCPRGFSQATPEGSEFQVNTYTTESQDDSCVVLDATGNFIIAWESYIQDASGNGVFAQAFNAQGTPIGSEFQVNTYTTGSQDDCSVAMDSGGNFVIVWESYGQDSSYGDDGVFAQLFNAQATPIGSEFQVNTYTMGNQDDCSVAMDASGNFVIAWESPGQDGDARGVFAQAFNAQATPMGSEFQVNTYTVGSQDDCSIAMDTGGSFVIAWESPGQDGDATGVFAQLFNALATPIGGEFRVNTYTTSYQDDPSVAMDLSGNFVIAWESDIQDASGEGVFAQAFNAQATPIGSEFQVNTYTTYDQRDPCVAMAPNGDFVIAWTDGDWAYGGQDGSRYGVSAQAFNAQATPVGGEFQVNTYTTDEQMDPSVAINAAGDFVISWESYYQDGGYNGVFAQRFSSTLVVEDWLDY